MLEKAIILASAATMLGIGVLAPSLPGNGKRGEDSAEIAERIGQYDCHSSRVRGGIRAESSCGITDSIGFSGRRGELSKVPAGGPREPHYSASALTPGLARGRSQGGRSSAQKLKDACKLMMRFAVCELYGPPASAFDSPNCGEVRIPIGVARLT